jgi:hypothetical protein
MKLVYGLYYLISLPLMVVAVSCVATAAILAALGTFLRECTIFTDPRFQKEGR